MKGFGKLRNANNNFMFLYSNIGLSYYIKRLDEYNHLLPIFYLLILCFLEQDGHWFVSIKSFIVPLVNQVFIILYNTSETQDIQTLSTSINISTFGIDPHNIKRNALTSHYLPLFLTNVHRWCHLLHLVFAPMFLQSIKLW
jgi:hypothetical protein